jgi:hypothetical protein
MAERIPFTTEFGGKSYDCVRTVTGDGVLKQTILVHSVGSKVDPANYGPGGHHISSMESTAKLIAMGLVGAQRRGNEPSLVEGPARL